MKSEFLVGFTCFPVPEETHGDIESERASVGEHVSRCVGRFQALRQLQHPNLCRYLDLLVGRDHLLFVITEHASRTLADALRACPKGLDEQLTVRAAAQVVTALYHLNSQGLVHGHLEPESVLIDEDDRLKLTGHGLEHLMRHGPWARHPLRARGSYLPPEFAEDADASESKGNFAPCCKGDVWSLGILIREMLHGPWRGEEDGGISSDEVVAMEACVRLETARILRRCGRSLAEQHGSSSAAELLGDGSLASTELLEGLSLPVPSSFKAGEVMPRRLEESYRCWLSGRACSRGGQDLRELWTACLTILPMQRPTPGDLASHPVLAGVGDSMPLGAGALQWTSHPALQCERLGPLLPPKELREESSEGSPLETLCGQGAEVAHLFYWWDLAGGDAFEVIAERRLLRPVPPIFRLPLLVRDGGAATGDTSRTVGEVLPFLDACLEAEGHPLPPHGHPRGLWGPPPGARRLPTVGADLRGLVKAVAAAERVGVAEAKTVRPRSLYERQHHFTYQWLRVRQFQRLLLMLPKSRPDIFREAAEDVPPLLRPKVWSAILGADPDSDSGCWALFYERLLASPVERSAEDRRLAQETQLCHELLNNPDAKERLSRLVHGVLKANPSLTRVDGLGALAAPVSVLFASSEATAFLVLQRILHGFVWNFYAEESAAHRQQCMHLFSALLRFTDPELEMHLQNMGMQPDVYAGTWFSTWFAELLPLHQLFLLWDGILLMAPQFPLFIGVCLLHFFRGAFLAMDDVSHMVSFLGSSAQFVDVGLIVQASLALFDAVPSSVTLPLYPKHSAGAALLTTPGSVGMAAVDPAWSNELPSVSDVDGDADGYGGMHEAPIHKHASEQLVQRAMRQWQQCEWWRRRATSLPTPPVITVDDLLSFRSRCYVLDVRSQEEFAEGHFQASSHIRDPVAGELSVIVPADVIAMGISRPTSAVAGESASTADVDTANGSASASGVPTTTPWLFGFDPGEDLPKLRVRLVVVIGGSDDFGTAFAGRLLNAGVRHVVCLLGGMGALWEDARSYLTTANNGS